MAELRTEDWFLMSLVKKSCSWLSSKKDVGFQEENNSLPVLIRAFSSTMPLETRGSAAAPRRSTRRRAGINDVSEVEEDKVPVLAARLQIACLPGLFRTGRSWRGFHSRESPSRYLQKNGCPKHFLDGSPLGAFLRDVPAFEAQLPSQPPLLSRVTSTQVEQEEQ